MSILSDLGTKVGAEFKSHRLRIEDLETGKLDTSGGTITGDVTISGVSRSTTTTNGDSLTFDLSTTNNFTANVSNGGTLTFSNLSDGQSGNIVLINSGVTIAKASNVKTTSDFLTTVGVAGTFWLSYICDGTNVYVTASTKLS